MTMLGFSVGGGALAQLTSHQRWVAGRIANRTGTQVMVDSRRGLICWGHSKNGSPSIMFSRPMFRDPSNSIPTSFDPVLGEMGEDDVVRFIGYAKQPWRRKQEWMEQHKAESESQKAAEKDAACADMGEAAADRFISSGRTSVLV